MSTRAKSNSHYSRDGIMCADEWDACLWSGGNVCVVDEQREIERTLLIHVFQFFSILVQFMSSSLNVIRKV